MNCFPSLTQNPRNFLASVLSTVKFRTLKRKGLENWKSVLPPLAPPIPLRVHFSLNADYSFENR